MIERIRIQGFKSLADVSLELGSFNLLLGSNASGKTNFLEALQVLQGLAYGFTVDEVLNGKSRSATGEVWEGVRGGSSAAPFGGEPGLLLVPRAPKKIEIEVEVRAGKSLYVYSVRFSPRQLKISHEKLVADRVTQFEADGLDSDRSTLQLQEFGRSGPINAERSVLSQRSEGSAAGLVDEVDPSMECVHLMRNLQRLEPAPAILRGYSTRHRIKRMGDHGEDFAAVVESIIKNPNQKAAFEDWLRPIAADEIDRVEVAKGAQGDVLFAALHKKRRMLAPSLSDGTLRFAALTAAFFQKDVPRTLLLEEIENGIHPPRIRALLDLLRSQSARTGAQVFATTHSPTVVDWLTAEDYRHAFWFRRNEKTGATEVTPLSQIPNFAKLTKKYPASELFTEGWLETAP